MIKKSFRLTTVLVSLALCGGSLFPSVGEAAAVVPCNDGTGFYDITPCADRQFTGGEVSFPVFVDQVLTAGTAIISNTATDMTIAINMSQTTYTINKLQVFAAVWNSGCDFIPQNQAGNPKIGQFPFTAKLEPGTNSVSMGIPISSICGFNSFQNTPCIHLVIHLDLADSEGFQHTGFAKGSESQCWDGSRWGFCIVYPLCCFPPEGTIALSGTPNPVRRGRTLTLTATTPTNGTEPFTYKWFQDGVCFDITNVPILVYPIPNRLSFGEHVYQVRVKSNCGESPALLSNEITIEVVK